MTILRDSITAADIPTANLSAVAGYGDGLYQWSAADWQRYTGVTQLSIVVDSSHQGDILDVEQGDATPADVPGWCDRFSRPHRRRPTVYCNRATWPFIRAAVGNRKVDYWISTLDGTTVVPGAVAVQYRDAGGFDESVVLDTSWLVSMWNIDQKRAAVFPVILHFRSWPDSQQLVDKYASQIADDASNVEAVFTTILQELGPVPGPQADPRVDHIIQTLHSV